MDSFKGPKYTLLEHAFNEMTNAILQRTQFNTFYQCFVIDGKSPEFSRMEEREMRRLHHGWQCKLQEIFTAEFERIVKEDGYLKYLNRLDLDDDVMMKDEEMDLLSNKLKMIKEATMNSKDSLRGVYGRLQMEYEDVKRENERKRKILRDELQKIDDSIATLKKYVQEADS